MGAVNGCFIPQHHSEPTEYRGSHKGPRLKTHRRNLSATFNLSAIDDDLDVHNFVNINTATEEELMTLPGVNRVIAKNIIEYRRQIGGFRRVEDLALVSGVGADKLNQIRTDVHIISRPLPGSRDSSMRESRQDSESVRDSKQPRCGNGQALLINVNTANVFQLIKIKGIGMSVAQNIITHREKKGPFSSLDEVAKVKGIGAGILSAIRPYLTVAQSDSVELSPLDLTPSSPQSYPHLNGGTNVTPPPLQSRHEVDQMTDSRHCTNSSLENLLQILGPLAEVPKRPNILHPFNFKHKNRRAVRVATWNLQQCSLDKVSNPGVKDVICMTILENGLGILVIQELSHDKALYDICQELNQPTLPNVRKWPGHRGDWKCAVSEVAGRMFQNVEYNGFLYDSSQHIELLSAGLLGGNTAAFARVPYLGFFKVNKQLDFVLVSVHLKATGLQRVDATRTKMEVAQIADVLDCLSNQIPNEKDIIVAGDFNLQPNAEDFNLLRMKGYTNSIGTQVLTNISIRNLEGTCCYDNIWISKQTQAVWTGNSGVIREGLFSPWIPDGWRWGGVVSDHCPVYVELFADKDLDTGDLSVGANNIRFTVGSDS